jgi:anaerobic selenocysteine-containing dehydrogenase
MGWHLRRAYTAIRAGKPVEVSACWVYRDPKAPKTHDPTPTSCPVCGAQVSVRVMSRGGRVVFEAGKGLSRLKHPCFHLGEGMSRRRPGDMGDLFDGPHVAGRNVSE